jgi:hypothetical protein
MRQFGFGCLNVNNYTSPSAESEGSNDFIVFKLQLHGRGGLDGARVFAGSAKSYNPRIRNALASAHCRRIVGMLGVILIHPQTSDCDSSFLMTDSRL